MLALRAIRKDKVGLQKNTDSELLCVQLPSIFSLVSPRLHAFYPARGSIRVQPFLEQEVPCCCDLLQLGHLSCVCRRACVHRHTFIHMFMRAQAHMLHSLDGMAIIAAVCRIPGSIVWVAFPLFCFSIFCQHMLLVRWKLASVHKYEHKLIVIKKHWFNPKKLGFRS